MLKEKFGLVLKIEPVTFCSFISSDMQDTLHSGQIRLTLSWVNVKIISQKSISEYWKYSWYWVDAQDLRVMGRYSDSKLDHYSELNWFLKFWTKNFMSTVLCFRFPSIDSISIDSSPIAWGSSVVLTDNFIYSSYAKEWTVLINRLLMF